MLSHNYYDSSRSLRFMYSAALTEKTGRPPVFSIVRRPTLPSRLMVRRSRTGSWTENYSCETLRAQRISLVLLQETLAEAHAGKQISWDCLAVPVLKEKAMNFEEIERRLDE
jgi:hypothetical protein